MADKKKKETPYVPFKGSKAAEMYKTYEEYRAAINDKYKAGQAGTKLSDWKPSPAVDPASRNPGRSDPDYNKSGGRGTNTGMYGTVLPPASSSYLTNPNTVGGSQVPVPLGQTHGIPPEALAPSINASARGRGVPERMPAGLTPGEQSAYRAKHSARILEQRVGGQAAAAGQQAAGAAGWLGGTLNEGSDWYGERAGQLHGTYEKSIWDMINALISAMNG